MWTLTETVRDCVRPVERPMGSDRQKPTYHQFSTRSYNLYLLVINVDSLHHPHSCSCTDCDLLPTQMENSGVVHMLKTDKVEGTC